jgi:hypothetical protein
MSDILTFMETVLKKPAKITEGIYFSKNTGKFFEIVKRKNGTIRPKYVCGGYGPKVPEVMFRIHFEALKYYELIIPYED